VDGAPSLPTDLSEAIPVAHGGTQFRRDQKVGLFWEIYGVTPADSARADLVDDHSRRRESVETNFSAVADRAEAESVEHPLAGNGAAGVLSARSVRRSGPREYEMKLEAGSSATAIASRIIEVK